MAIAGLPLAEGWQATVRVFEPQMQKVRPMRLAVRGTETTSSPAGSFETFVLEVTPLGR